MAYTSFFRDIDALDAIEKYAIPSLAHWREIRVWDAGCATGEEPFTLAMLFATNLRPFPFRNLDILASDYEESSFPQFAQSIKNAKYHRKDVFWVPQKFFESFFIQTDDPEIFQLDQEIRDRVRYLQHDLLTFNAPEKEKSLIVCKNVLMHFSPEAQTRVINMFLHTLVPGGYLALDGNQKIPDEFMDYFTQLEPGAPLYKKVQ